MESLQSFKIGEVIERYGLDVEEVARLLFPLVKYPKLAFDRVLNGESDLDVKQVTSLASHIGVFVGDLFTIDSMTSHVENGNIVFTKGEYKAVVGIRKDFVTLFKGDEIVNKYMLNIDIISISDFINKINNFINDYEYTINNPG